MNRKNLIMTSVLIVISVFLVGCGEKPTDEVQGVYLPISSVSDKISVQEQTVFVEVYPWEDKEVIHDAADEILEEIITDEMTEREKAEAIYKWVKSNIRYDSHSEKGDYDRGAYEGLLYRCGDCFVFAATAKELLTRARIPNIDVVKSTTDPSHYWNLVYIDNGWYHFDCTPRKDKSDFFLLTDAELEAYSAANNFTHIYDKNLYPEVE